jgi:DNA-binding transcriptional regulator YiaG
MVTKREFKSYAFEAIHTVVEGMYAAGTIDKETMRTFDEACMFRLARVDSKRDQDAARKQSR